MNATSFPIQEKACDQQQDVFRKFGANKLKPGQEMEEAFSLNSIRMTQNIDFYNQLFKKQKQVKVKQLSAPW